ncbi:MAG: type II toxin-antitoxin system RelE/ParE family toxin [Isosphaeraceae bacterium]
MSTAKARRFHSSRSKGRQAGRSLAWFLLGRRTYVLHAFQKKSKKGIATPKPDVDLMKQRYKEAKELAEHEQDEE